MILNQLLQHLLNAQDYTNCANCVGASLFAATAAFQTQGMWVMSDILYYINSSSLGNFGPLIYACAAIAGMVGVALGMPPKNYMWFFLGPCFFLWLTDNPDQVTGTRWSVGYDHQQDQA